MTNFPSQKNNIIFAVILIIAVLLILATMWSFDNQLTQRMVEYCDNISMEYGYKDAGSFYCFSTNGSITTKEIRYG